MTEPRNTFLRSMRTVAWAFLGLRKRSGHEEDLSHLRPSHIIVAGLISGAVFVLLLILAVRMATA
ncbi:MAG: DUF2970 domain-containing protein [Castellaniella sp.]|uniref:DUF2970 domain-containing protein n=1 Tax=Castellaniella hirudinis TaxID=1144617 RepID=A0ABV8RZY3_9BURK